MKQPGEAGRLYVFLNGKTVSANYTPSNPTKETISEAKNKLDTNCKAARADMPKKIALPDGTIFYNTASVTFERAYTQNASKKRVTGIKDIFPAR